MFFSFFLYEWNEILLYISFLPFRVCISFDWFSVPIREQLLIRELCRFLIFCVLFAAPSSCIRSARNAFFYLFMVFSLIVITLFESKSPLLNQWLILTSRSHALAIRAADECHCLLSCVSVSVCASLLMIFLAANCYDSYHPALSLLS